MAKKKSPFEVLDKAYLHTQPQEEALTQFTNALLELLGKLRVDDKEDPNKTLFVNFLRDAFYGAEYIITPSNNNIDFSISLQEERDEPFVLAEAKRFGTDEMIDDEHINRKALRQLVLYYLREESKQNRNIRHLIVTDYQKIYLFDKMNFLKLFYEDKTFRKKVLDCDVQGYRTGTIYDEAIKQKIAEVEARIEYTCVDISKIKRELPAGDTANTTTFGLMAYKQSREVRYLFKLLSEIHLRKLPFQADHNTLNTDFYNELLYIMGVVERIKKGTAYIQRIEESEREPNSLLEQAIRQIEDHQPELTEEETYDEALGLVITWVNRLLFLKLLEAQLLRGNMIEQKFLTSANIRSFNELQYLFVRILGRAEDERTDVIDAEHPDVLKLWAKKYKNVPYLNSSLFDVTDQESRLVAIDCLMNGMVSNVYKKTKLRNHGKKADGTVRKILDYILDFLDIYDFGADASVNVELHTKQSQKPIINAAVLGLIFEKINGYKDGAFYTPSYISGFVCREVLYPTALKKLNEHLDTAYANIEDVIQREDFTDPVRRMKANEAINSLTICDPAVGSGHFLVTMLNELICLKYDLGILQDCEQHRRLTAYRINVENDELAIVDGEGDYFVYDPKNEDSRKLQKTLFAEKQALIQNCLFGVDLNHKSVEICRLRLWIELLKNLYREDKHYCTLPNIDMKIKCGNSLLAKERVAIGGNAFKSQFDRKTTELVRIYREYVEEYKYQTDKKRKAELLIKMKQTKECYYVSNSANLFGDKKPKQTTIDIAYDSRFEWMVEFPEVLDAEGNFLGFDAVIGNPPYISIKATGLSVVYGQELKQNKTSQKKKLYATFNPDGDIYALFYELGYKLLKPDGVLAFITSRKWMRNQSCEELRSFLSQRMNPQTLVDLRRLQLFHNATVETCILILTKGENLHHTLCVETNKEDEKAVKEDLTAFAKEEKRITVHDFSTSDNWVLATPFEYDMKRQMEAGCSLLKDCGIKVTSGIKTGNNNIFILNSSEAKDAILNRCTSEEERRMTEELLQPLLRGEDISRYATNWSDLWLVNTHNGMEGKFEAVDIEKLPTLKSYLDEYYDKISARGDQGDTPYNLRNCAYLEDLSKPMIVWGELSDKAKFALQQGCVPLNTVFFMTGEHLEEILAVLNSKAVLWYFHTFKCSYSGQGTARWLKYTVEEIPVMQTFPNELKEKVKQRMQKEQENEGEEAKERLDAEIDEIIYEAYGFNPEQKAYLRQWTI